MPSLGQFHPPIVHFAVALLPVGLAFRWLFLTGRAAFADPAARALLLAGALASVLAVKSGTDAHGPVERVPGARQAVVDHEDWGKRARNVFLVVAVLELAAIGAARLGRARPVLIASGVVGLVGLVCIFEAGEHGGELVYSYAGGVGIREGKSEDVGRLLLAGLYHQAQQDRKDGRAEDAALLVDTAARRFPGDLEVQLLAAESRLVDRRDARGALERLEAVHVPAADRRLRIRHASLTADALVAAGQVEGAKALLRSLSAELPDDPRLKRKLDAVSAVPAPAPATPASPATAQVPATAVPSASPAPDAGPTPAASPAGASPSPSPSPS